MRSLVIQFPPYAPAYVGKCLLRALLAIGDLIQRRTDLIQVETGYRQRRKVGWPGARSQVHQGSKAPAKRRAFPQFRRSQRRTEIRDVIDRPGKENLGLIRLQPDENPRLLLDGGSPPECRSRPRRTQRARYFPDARQEAGLPQCHTVAAEHTSLSNRV